MIVDNEPIDETQVLADIRALEEVGNPSTPTTVVQQEEEEETPDISETSTEEVEEETLEENSQEEPKGDGVSKEVEIQQALKKQERELKKKYLSQISILKSKPIQKSQTDEVIETLKANGYDDEQINVLTKLSSAQITDFRIQEIEKQERKTFISSNSDLSRSEIDEIDDIKTSFPDMAWESAKKLYFAENAPERLGTSKKTKPIIS